MKPHKIGKKIIGFKFNNQNCFTDDGVMKEKNKISY